MLRVGVLIAVALFAVPLCSACLADDVTDSESTDASLPAPDGQVGAADAQSSPLDASSPMDAGQANLDAQTPRDGGIDPDTGSMGDDDAGFAGTQPRFVTVGDEGAWSSTPNGVDWTVNPPDGQYESLLRRIAYADGRFYALGGGGATSVLRTSDDGLRWTTRNAPSGWISGAAWLPSVGAMVFVGSNGYRYRSFDRGQTLVDPAGFYEGHFRDAAYGNGRIVAVGNTYGFVGLSSTTQDGRTWTPMVVNGSQFTAVEYGRGLFVAVGYDGRISRSTDGQQWSDITFAGQPLIANISFGDGVFVINVLGTGYESTDGENWTTMGPAPNLMMFGNGRWVGITGEGRSATSTDRRQWTGTNGIALPARAGVFGWVQP